MSEDLFGGDVAISGTLDAIRFESAEGDFVVAVVQTARGATTVVGNLRGAAVGERLQLRGKWEQNPKFGRQFRVTDALALPPTTRQGITRYLGSGLIEGIGPVLAERLVAAFGEATLDVIETERHRLREVAGIGAVRQKRILEAWDKQRAVRKVMVFLSAHGVSSTFAHRIYEAYGDEAVDVVQQQPYRLARDIFGIGFKSADRIALNLGAAPDSPERIAAGLEWALEEASGEGHVFLPRPELVARAAELLGVEPAQVTAVVGSALADGSLIEDGRVATDDPAIYSRSAYLTEVELADRVAALAEASRPAAEADRWLAAARQAERRLGISLEGGQRKAVEHLIGRRLAVLTGGPGTGKTTLVRLFADAAAALNLRIVLGAPTGRAARRLSEATGRPAETLHRLLQFSFAERRFLRDQNQPLTADLIVVDEVSMLDQWLARALLRAVPPEGSLLLVGDADQLPSVGPGNVLHDLLAARAVPSASLEEVFRQAANSAIVHNAHRIRKGMLPERLAAQKDARSDFYHISVETPEAARDRVVEMVVERIPKAFQLHPIDGVQVLSPMHRGACGIDALNTALQQALNPRGRAVRMMGERELRVGDKVIQLRNNYQREVFNGEIGRLTAVDEETGEVKVRFEDRTVAYPRNDLQELALAYCISIHKSQGSEFPAVVVPLVTQHHVMLQRNLLYTAITRARRLVCLAGQPQAMSRAVRNASPQRRYTALATRLRR